MIKEANRDVAYGYAIASVLEFKQSEPFPTKVELMQSANKENLLLANFYKWVERCSTEDEGFQYYMESVLFFGPLKEWFYESIQLGNGIDREACYLLFLPMFVQLKKKNYFANTLVHVVNFIARWPLISRVLVRQNCSVNVSGREGHNIAFDEFMETFVVRPLKSYASGKTTVKVLKAISGSIQLISSVRNVYMSKSGFDVHRTKKHSVAYSLPDQLKVALFCLKERMFQEDKTRKKVRMIENETFGVKQGFVVNDRLDVFGKGKKKVRENFDRRMYELFPERRRMFSSDQE